MGYPAQILLVSRRAALGGVACALMLGSCRDRATRRVDPRNHDAFFLWAGVPAPLSLASARTVYLLAGEVRHGDRALVPLRAIPAVKGPVIWPTVRVERLDWPEATLKAILRLPGRWEAAGNRVAGLQIDFDAATRRLDRYGSFLEDLRRRLPRRFALSVTGLLDWSAGGDPRALVRLAGVVDEIVVQTYQGRRTIPGYERYLAALPGLGIPYRVGVVEGGEWEEPEALLADPLYRGTVVFLLRRAVVP